VSGKKKAADLQARSFLAGAVCIAAALLSLAGAFRSWDLSAAYANQFPDPYGAGMAETRLAPLLAGIPNNASVGYITDIEPSDSRYPAAWMAAQYALAPRHLVQLTGATSPIWAIGNFFQPGDHAAIGAAKGYKVEADFGNGVLLFRR
jgi:hypothetical protein